MSRGRLSSTADTADWSFTNHSETVEALLDMSEALGRSYGMDPSDLFQELAMWIAVRPWTYFYDNLDNEDTRSNFLNWARQHAHDLAKSYTRDDWRSMPLLAEEDEE